MISCIEYSNIRTDELKNKIKNFVRKPKLCVIQVGDDDASNRYTRNKRIACEKVGIVFDHVRLPDNITQKELESVVYNNQCDYDVDGIIVQLPLPDHIDVNRITNLIFPEKDVDGFRRDSYFDPCTPRGIMDWLDYNEVNLRGKVCTVVGRSEIVGRPMVNMLIKRGATVLNCNSRTANIKRYTKEADIVVSAIGRPNYFNENHFSCNQILIDVGINIDENGKFCGDISKDVKENVKYGTPVPGGVGKLTVLRLLENVVEAYERNMK